MNLSVSANALQSALARAETVAESVALGPGSPDYATDLVDLKLAQREVESAAEVLEMQSEMLGYLLDEFV